MSDYSIENRRGAPNVRAMTELEFRDAVDFVAYQLERGEISRTLAASDLRRFVRGRALKERYESDAERRKAIHDLAALKRAATTPLDHGVARFAAEVVELATVLP